jgi:hypothetical protein
VVDFVGVVVVVMVVVVPPDGAAGAAAAIVTTLVALAVYPLASVSVSVTVYAPAVA